MPGGPPPGPPCSSCTACNFPHPNLCAQDAFNSIGSFPGALINDLRQQVRTEGRWQPYCSFSPLITFPYITISPSVHSIGLLEYRNRVQSGCLHNLTYFLFNTTLFHSLTYSFQVMSGAAFAEFKNMHACDGDLRFAKAPRCISVLSKGVGLQGWTGGKLARLSHGSDDGNNLYTSILVGGGGGRMARGSLAAGLQDEGDDDDDPRGFRRRTIEPRVQFNDVISCKSPAAKKVILEDDPFQ